MFRLKKISIGDAVIAALSILIWKHGSIIFDRLLLVFVQKGFHALGGKFQRLNFLKRA